MKLFRFITNIFNVFYKARIIKNDPDKQPKSVRFGVYSIIYAIIALACAALGAWLFKFSMQNADDLFILFIFTLVFAIAFMLGGILTAVGAILRAAAQLSINKRAIGIISLIVSIACVVGAVALFIIIML